VSSTGVRRGDQGAGDPGRRGGEYVIETEGLCKVYRLGTSPVHAVQDVSLRVEAGEFVALMGRSGSGKSTLMHLLGCLDTPTRGTYRLEGRAVGSLAPAERARVRNEHIGFVFQTFNLLPRRSALDNVILPLAYARRRPAAGDEARARGLALLERVGLGRRAHHRPPELSGGERQRVAIARALIAGPALILADEPTGNLDNATGDEVMALLSELSREWRTILVVTHSPEVAGFASRVLHMVDGRLDDAGPGGVP
jgi:putative ABC transport system ATP-binding protein